ncbi:hypothetical protein [Bacillus sp. TL12]|uniref:hypothetical protein n=1 Tax=Bacillus sp. TL12 TaxID=2894756 RepID=UPI001F521624|nr:hypothetical protein [Bacillus sp. TL12]MCI0763886.1 hypothetical protein [Bacillus sp. TL12]
MLSIKDIELQIEEQVQNKAVPGFEDQYYPCFPITASVFYAGEYGLLRFAKNTSGSPVLSIQDAWHLEYVGEEVKIK